MRRFFATRVLHPMPHLTRCELLESGYWAYVCFGGNGMRETIARESLEDALGAFRSLDFYVVMFGLALCRAWIVLCLSAPFVVSEIGVSDWLFLIPGALSTLAAAFVAYRVAQRARFDRRFKAITGAMVGVCVLGSPVVVLGQSTIGMVAFMVLGGVASSCLQVLWGVGFARRKASFSLYCYPSSAIVTAVLVAIVLFEGGLLAFCLYPIASFLLLLVSTSKSTGVELADDGDTASGDPTVERGESTSGRKPLPYHVIGRLLVSIVIFSFLCRMYDALPSGGAVDPLSAIGGSSLFALVVTGALFLVFSVLLGRVFNPLFGYRIALPLMALGMAIVSLFFSDHWYLSILLIGVGYELFDTLTWILLVALAQNQQVRLSQYVIFGLGTAATMLGMGIGYFAGGTVRESIVYGSLQVSSIGIVSVMVLVVTAFLVLPEGTFAQLAGRRLFDRDGGKAIVREADAAGNPLETGCDAIADEYRLTPREKDVLLLLARGRTLAIIMRDLGIAKGTAQTHIENVYHKLGVHKQQELIDLVESYVGI